MDRYILHMQDSNQLPESVVENVRSMPNTTIVDSTPHMLLLEGGETQLRELVGKTPKLSLSRDWTVETPNPWPKPLQPPSKRKSR